MSMETIPLFSSTPSSVRAAAANTKDRFLKCLPDDLTSLEGFTETETNCLQFWREEITANRMFTPRPYAASQESPFANALIARFLEAVKTSFEEELIIPLWNSLEALREATENTLFAQKISQITDDMGAQIAAEMLTLFPSDSDLPFTEGELQENISRFLDEWVKGSVENPSIEQKINFILLFTNHFLGRYELSLDFWQIFLARLELYGGRQMNPGQASPWDAPITVMESAPLVLITIKAYYQAVNNDKESSESVWRAWIPTLAILRATESPLRDQFLQVCPQVFFEQGETENDPLLQKSAKWMAELRKTMERSALDPLADQCSWIQEVRNFQSAREAFLKANGDHFDKVGNDLAQGLKGSDAGTTICNLYEFMVGQALQLAVLDGGTARSGQLLIQKVILEVGVDPKKEIWKKASQLVASAKNLLSGEKAPTIANQAILLLQMLQKRVEEIRVFHLDVLETIPSLEDELQKMPDVKCSRDARLTLTRLLIEGRLKGVKEAANGTLLWYSQNVAPYLREVTPDQLQPFLETVAEMVVNEETVPLTVARMLHQFAEEFPRLTAGFKILRNAREISLYTAEFVFNQIPEYADKVGEQGKESCARDNQLTLEKTGFLIIRGTAEAGEVLQEWWSGVVGTYLANRPDRLFESNLQGLFNGLSKFLNNREIPLAFGPIAEVYRETLGVECLAAKASLPLPISGTLWKGTLARRAPAYENFLQLPEIEESVLQGAVERLLVGCTTEEPIHLLDSFREYLQNLAQNGDPEAAVRSQMSKLTSFAENIGSARAAHFLRAILHQNIGLQGPLGMPVLEAARAYNFYLGQAGLAQKLLAHSKAIAARFAEKLASMAPAFFPEADAEVIRNKCIRDQSILLERLGQLLATEPQSVYWPSSVRYLLEILLPHISYPAEIWKMAFRNVAEELTPYLDFQEKRSLLRWLGHWEDISEGLEGLSPIAEKYFVLEDYTFSANAEEEKLMRDILSTCLCAALIRPSATLNNRLILQRFCFSLTLPFDDLIPEITKVVEKLESALGEGLYPLLTEQFALLKKELNTIAGLVDVPAELSPQFVVYQTLHWPRFNQALHKAIAYAAHTEPESSALAARESTLLAEEGWMVANSDHIEKNLTAWNQWSEILENCSPSEYLLLAETLFVHLLFPINGEARSLDSSFKQEWLERVSLIPSNYFPSKTISLVEKYLPKLVEIAPDANRLRSDLRRVISYIPLVENSKEIDQIEISGESDSAQSCRLSFLKTLLTEGPQTPTATVPVIGAGMSRTSFANYDFAGYGDEQTNLFLELAKSTKLEHPHSLTGAFLATQNRLTPAINRNWLSFLRQNEARNEPLVERFFVHIKPLAELIAPRLGADFPDQEAKLTEKVMFHLDALTCTLREAGDLEASLEEIKAQLVYDLTDIPAEGMVSAYYHLQGVMPEQLPTSEIPFWTFCIGEIIRAVREVALGTLLDRQADKLAQENATFLLKGYQNPSSEVKDKCLRDQSVLVRALAYGLKTHAPHRQILQIGRFLLQTTLPYLHDDGSTLARIFTGYEKHLMTKAGAQEKFALWDLSFTWQNLLPRLVSLSRFFATARKELAPVTDPFGHRQNEEDLLAGLCVAGALDFPHPLCHADGVLAATILGAQGNNPKSYGYNRLLDRNLDHWENQGIAVPGSIQQAVTAYQQTLTGYHSLSSKPGSALTRCLALRGRSAFGRSLWEMSLLARSQGSQNQTDTADLLLAKHWGIDIPEPTAVRKLEQKLTWIKSEWDQLEIKTAQPVKKGFFQKILKREEPPTPVNREALRQEAAFLAKLSSVQEILGQQVKDRLRYFLFCPSTQMRSQPQTAAGTFAFYRELASSLGESLGDSHPLTIAFLEFAEELPKAQRAFDSLAHDPGPSGSLHFAALAFLGWKDSGQTTAYRPETSGDALLAITQLQKECLDLFPEESPDREFFAIIWKNLSQNESSR
ncbi:MAG: hypothetical protein LAT55_07775 [Opitutales bacterium]|nr:hypothetical protein [Opitutales bacterium]